MYVTVSCQLLKAGSAASPVRLLLKCDGTRKETKFCLSAKRTRAFKSATEVCASVVVMMFTPCYEVV